MRRIMCVWLPRLPLDRLARQGDPRLEGPFAIVSDIKNAFRLTHLSPGAVESGLYVGMSVPDARAIEPGLLTEKGDPIREGLLLKSLRRWAGSLSPWVTSIPPDMLILDISGCAHLFAGEHRMAVHTVSRLSDMKISSRIAIADTKGGAQALAKFHVDTISVSEAGTIRSSLKTLPLAALNISQDIEHDLRRTGIKLIGQLYNHKSSELARRFGLELPQTLSKALGHTPDPVCPKDPEAVFAARMNLPTPIGLRKDVDAVFDRLCHSVCLRLKKSQKGARFFNLTIRCVDSGDHVLTAGFATPSHDTEAVKRQFDQPLNKLKIDFGADWFRLEARTVEPIHVSQRQLLGADATEKDDISSLISTLGNRLGFDKIRRFIPQDSYLPEFEYTSVEAIETGPVLEWPAAQRERPLRFFPPEPVKMLINGRPPKVFEWKKDVFTTLHAGGPERLFPEWWRDQAGFIRDYWRVCTENGPR